MSKYYYQRLFCRLVRKNVYEYLKLRCLAKTAEKLRDQSRTIFDVAFECEFTSHTWKILNAGTNIMYYSIGAHPGFPAAAVWTMPSSIDSAKYLCIEPWCGINDFVGQGVQDISHKYLIQPLDNK